MSWAVPSCEEPSFGDAARVERDVGQCDPAHCSVEQPPVVLLSSEVGFVQQGVADEVDLTFPTAAYGTRRPRTASQ